MRGAVRRNSIGLRKRSQNDVATPSLKTLPTPTQAYFEQNPEEPQISPRCLEHPNERYSIRHAALIGPKLSQMQRYKMMKWLLNEANKRHYTREVFAKTCYYLDLYLPKVADFNLENLQLLALSALFIATKIQGVVFPQIGGEISKASILQIEKDICLALNYFLNPPTYLHYLDRYLQHWDQFSQKRTEQPGYLAKTGQAFQRARTLYETIEAVNMVGCSLKYEWSALALNLFYLLNKVNMDKIDLISMSLGDVERYIQKAYLQEDSYSSLFNQFVKFCYQQDFLPPELDVGIGLYLAPFIRLPVETTPPARMSINYEMYFRLQTVSPSALKELDNLAKTLK